MRQVKMVLKQQADQAHYAALMEGIQKNCLNACDNDSSSALGKANFSAKISFELFSENDNW